MGFRLYAYPQSILFRRPRSSKDQCFPYAAIHLLVRPTLRMDCSKILASFRAAEYDLPRLIDDGDFAKRAA